MPHLAASPAQLLCLSLSSICLTPHLGGSGPGREGTGSPMSVNGEQPLCPHTQWWIQGQGGKPINHPSKHWGEEACIGGIGSQMGHTDRSITIEEIKEVLEKSGCLFLIVDWSVLCRSVRLNWLTVVQIFYKLLRFSHKIFDTSFSPLNLSYVLFVFQSSIIVYTLILDSCIFLWN